jgi:hypothetical protein
VIKEYITKFGKEKQEHNIKMSMKESFMLLHHGNKKKSRPLGKVDKLK